MIILLIKGLFFYYNYRILVFFPNKKVPYYSIYIIYFLVLISLYSFYLGCVIDPGIINKKNYKIMKLNYSNII